MKIFKYQIIFLLNAILMVGCSTNKRLIPSNNGFYRIKTCKSYSINRTVISGNFYDYDTKLHLFAPVVTVNDYFQHKGDIKGKYKFSVQPDIWVFTGKAYPYKFVETMPVNVKRGDSIRIDFYLKKVKTPIYN